MWQRLAHIELSEVGNIALTFRAKLALDQNFGEQVEEIWCPAYPLLNVTAHLLHCFGGDAGLDVIKQGLLLRLIVQGFYRRVVDKVGPVMILDHGLNELLQHVDRSLWVAISVKPLQIQDHLRGEVVFLINELL